MSRKIVQDPESPTTPWVRAFAREMEAKLAENRHKGDREMIADVAGGMRPIPQESEGRDG